jgi:hypothetical protein
VAQVLVSATVPVNALGSSAHCGVWLQRQAHGQRTSSSVTKFKPLPSSIADKGSNAPSVRRLEQRLADFGFGRADDDGRSLS